MILHTIWKTIEALCQSGVLIFTLASGIIIHSTAIPENRAVITAIYATFVSLMMIAEYINQCWTRKVSLRYGWEW